MSSNTTSSSVDDPQATFAKMKSTMKHASQETSAYIILALGLLFISSAIITLPALYDDISSGRLKTGWKLKRSKIENRITTSTSTLSRPTPKLSILTPSTKFFVIFRRHYNSILLRTIPFLDLTVGQCLVLLFIFILFIFGHIYKNLNHMNTNFKRPGWISITFLPVILITSMKNTPLGIFGKGYERINFIHRFTARLLIISGLLHGALWLKGRLASGLPIELNQPIFTGIIAITSFVIIFLSSLKAFRSRFYQTFVFLHMTGYLVALLALWMHDNALSPFVAVSVAALILDGLQVYLVKSRRCSASMTALPAGMTQIEINQLGDGWRAGQHVYLRVMRGKLGFQKHPFTIANAPSSICPSLLILVAKATGDFTKELYNIGMMDHINFSTQIEKDEDGKSDFAFEDPHERRPLIPITIEGPYGALHADMCQHETVVLVCGGSGITYGLSVLQDIVGHALHGRAATQRLYIIWSLRDLELTQVFAERLNESLQLAQRSGLQIIFRIHLTQSHSFSHHQDHQNLVKFSQMIYNRIEFSNLMKEVLQHTHLGLQVRRAEVGSGIGVTACGPTSMISSLRNAIADTDPSITDQVGGISVHCERFDW